VSEGAFAARFTKTGAVASGLGILSDTFTLVPGAWYLLTLKAKASIASQELRTVIRNTTDSTRLKVADLDGMTWGTGGAGNNWDAVLATAYGLPSLGGATVADRRPGLSFKVPENAGAAALYEIELIHLTAAVSNIFVDDIQIQGPLAGVFRDTDYGPGQGISRNSFRWSTDVKEREINRVEVDFLNESGALGQDRAVANDFDHQKHHPVKVLGIDGDAVADRDQAGRIADYYLARSRTLGTGARIEVGPAGLVVQPGDLVAIFHELPPWSGDLKRVVKREVRGLGTRRELAVGLEVEDYQASIYTDTGPPASDLVTRALGTLTATIDKASNRQVELSWSWSADTNAVTRYTIHQSSSAGFSPRRLNQIGVTRTDNFTWRVPDDKFSPMVTLYFIVVAWTDRGIVEAAEVSILATNLEDEDLDPIGTQFRGPDNMVWGGAFETPGDWTTVQAPLRGPQEFPTINGLMSGRSAYNNPANAQDDDADFADGDETNPGAESGHEWRGISSGTKGGRLTVEHSKFDALGTITQQVQFSTDGGSTYQLTTAWDTGDGDSSSSTPETCTETLVAQLMSDLWVRGKTEGGSPGDAGEGRVSRIYFEEDDGGDRVASVAGGTFKIAGNGLGQVSAVQRLFPLRINVVRQHIPDGGWLTGILSLRNADAGQQADQDLIVQVRIEGGGGWVTTVATIKAAQITDAWKQFGFPPVQVAASVPDAKLEVRIETASGETIEGDDLMIVPGKQIPQLYRSHPVEQDDGAGTGTVGDWSSGAPGGGGGFPGGGDKPGGDPIEV